MALLAVLPGILFSLSDFYALCFIQVYVYDYLLDIIVKLFLVCIIAISTCLTKSNEEISVGVHKDNSFGIPLMKWDLVCRLRPKK